MGCTYAGSDYSEGSLICQNGREQRCSGGEWQETGYLCTLMAENDPATYLRISRDGLSVSHVSKSAGTYVLPCVKFILGAPYGKLRLFNECGECKEVAISWSDGPIQRVQVPGFQHTDIPNRAQAGQIAGERNC